MLDYVKLIVLAVIALLAAIAANYAHDLAYMANAVVVMLAAAITFVWQIQRVGVVTLHPPTEYMDGVVRAGVIATSLWGIVGFLVGVVIAFQLAFPSLNIEMQGILNFGRLRPLHTSAVIFAFGGNALIMSSFYIVQRTCATRLWGGNLGWFVFWGWQLMIVPPRPTFWAAVRAKNTPRRFGTSTFGLRLFGWPFCWSLWARFGTAKNRISMWPTGFCCR
jgi:cytochrome c oxidase cbb3-type subunit 1